MLESGQASDDEKRHVSCEADLSVLLLHVLNVGLPHILKLILMAHLSRPHASTAHTGRHSAADRINQMVFSDREREQV